LNNNKNPPHPSLSPLRITKGTFSLSRGEKKKAGKGRSRGRFSDNYLPEPFCVQKEKLESPRERHICKKDKGD